MAQIKNIKQQAIQNEFFRQVVATGKHVQIVIMSIPAGEEIGEETHPDNDQSLYLVQGNGKVVLDGQESEFNAGDLALVSAGVRHNFMAGGSAMKIITTYSPPHHPDGTIHKTKEEADAANY